MISDVRKNYFKTYFVNELNLLLLIIITIDPLAQTQMFEKFYIGKQKNFRKDHNSNTVHSIASNTWSIQSTLHAKTKAFMCAIQDQVINTKKYQKSILIFIKKKTEKSAVIIEVACPLSNNVLQCIEIE